MQLAILLFVLSAGILVVHGAFSGTGIQEILNVHNSLKSRIARGVYVAKGVNKPRAANMLKYKWDVNTAKIAQTYADTCPTGHSKTLSKEYGENLYWMCSTGPLDTEGLDKYGADASKSWENEFQDFGWKYNKLDMALFNTGIGHATQMAWWKTDLVGCGVKDCKDGDIFKVVVVCNYKPAGNYMNQYIYMEGPTCSACPSGKKCETATGLCV